ncbi:hypothetical protein [Microbacterium oleivorans]|uniref:Uncharacterized protein n=1 Tax=Microbacterium oleivorans TaxID=273677 RepID=A0A7D5IXA4_9MICO|nr:hypothetical protein [Microbacterium oleivorans]QLD12642.1 hypothetical protein HW566_13170 [Microbacterium oleivorans]
MTDPHTRPGAEPGDAGDGVETGTTTGGASAFPGSPSAAPDEPAPDETDGSDTTTDADGDPLENPSGG